MAEAHRVGVSVRRASEKKRRSRTTSALAVRPPAWTPPGMTLKRVGD